MKRIIVAGMTQSGSTLCFNLIRSICECAGKSVYSRGLFKGHPYDKHTKADVHVLKCHDYKPSILSPPPARYKVGSSEVILGQDDTTIVCQRDIRDCVASRMRRIQGLGFGSPVNRLDTDEQILEYCNNLLGPMYQEWSSYFDYRFIYERYVKSSLSVVKELSELVGCPDIDCKLPIEYTEKLKQNPDLPLIDSVKNPIWVSTMMTKAHVTNNGSVGGFSDYLTNDQIRLVESNFGSWLDEHLHARSNLPPCSKSNLSRGFVMSMHDEHEIVLSNIRKIQEEIPNSLICVVHSQSPHSPELKEIRKLCDIYIGLTNLGDSYNRHSLPAQAITRNYSEGFSKMLDRDKFLYLVGMLGDTKILDPFNFERRFKEMKKRNWIVMMSQAIGQDFHAKDSDPENGKAGGRPQIVGIADFSPSLFIVDGDFAVENKCFSDIKITNPYCSEQCLGDHLLQFIPKEKFHQRVARLNTRILDCYSYGDGIQYHAKHGSPAGRWETK